MVVSCTSTAVFGLHGCKCLGWSSPSRVSFDAHEFGDKSWFCVWESLSVCVCVCVCVGGWRVSGTARLSSWRPEATGDLWPEDSWSVAGGALWVPVVMGAVLTQVEEPSDNGETIDAWAAVGDCVGNHSCNLGIDYRRIQRWWRGDRLLCPCECVWLIAGWQLKYCFRLKSPHKNAFLCPIPLTFSWHRGDWEWGWERDEIWPTCPLSSSTAKTRRNTSHSAAFAPVVRDQDRLSEEQQCEESVYQNLTQRHKNIPDFLTRLASVFCAELLSNLSWELLPMTQ